MTTFKSTMMTGALLMLGSAVALAGGPKQARLPIAAGGVLNIENNFGTVNLHPGTEQAILFTAVTHSDKVEVDSSSTADGGRVEIRTHALPSQRPNAEESRVDYEITVPVGISITVSTATAPITADNLSGDLSLASETGQITVRNVFRSHVHLRGVAAPLVLSNINASHIEVTSSGGNVQMIDVVGPKVTVNTTSGDISYKGDCSGGGQYVMTTHNGAIDVVLPESASVALTARSKSGSVQNDFPLEDSTHPTFPASPGRSFSGTSHSGSSSVELHSFSGRIRVKKK